MVLTALFFDIRPPLLHRLRLLRLGLITTCNACHIPLLLLTITSTGSIEEFEGKRAHHCRQFAGIEHQCGVLLLVRAVLLL